MQLRCYKGSESSLRAVTTSHKHAFLSILPVDAESLVSTLFSGLGERVSILFNCHTSRIKPGDVFRRELSGLVVVELAPAIDRFRILKKVIRESLRDPGHGLCEIVLCGRD